MCGSPRTGTALLAAMLWQPPRVVCVMEPWDALRQPPAELFESLRAELASGVLRRGRLDVAALEGAGEVRWCGDGECPAPVELEQQFRLGVKLPAFWRYLDLLPTTRFVVCLRSPVEVVASYRGAGGRLAEGLEYEAAFNRALNEELLAATDDPAHRRVLLFDHVHRALLPHLQRPEVHVVRYEQWFEDRDEVLRSLSAFLDVDLSSALAVVRPARAEQVTDADREAVRRWCTTAASLGYGDA